VRKPGRDQEQKTTCMNLKANLAANDQDLRPTLFLGIANCFLFLDHIPNNVVNLITTRNYGFSGASDLFIFISGYTAATVFAKIMLERGVLVGATRIFKRAWQLYAAYIVLFISYVVSIGYIAGQYSAPDLINEFNISSFVEHPVKILYHALFLQSKALNLDVLQLYTVLMVLFPPVLWMMVRRAGLTMTASLALYFGARAFGWNLASYPDGDWYFNPFCWQLLFVFGAWAALHRAQDCHPFLKSAIALDLAIAYLMFALVMTMAGRFPAFGQMFPAWLFDAFNPNDKENLAPYRALHFVVIVFVVTRFISKDWPGLKLPVFDPLIKCGEQSLAVFCVGVFLAFIGHFTLIISSGSVMMQILVSATGIAIMTLVAYYISWSKEQDSWKAVARSNEPARVSAEHGVGQPQRQDRHIGDDGKHDQKQDQERQDAADHLADRRRRNGREHEQIEPDRRMNQPDLHVVGEDN
jgi:hypothetical protein